MCPAAGDKTCCCPMVVMWLAQYLEPVPISTVLLAYCGDAMLTSLSSRTHARPTLHPDPLGETLHLRASRRVPAPGLTTAPRPLTALLGGAKLRTLRARTRCLVGIASRCPRDRDRGESITWVVRTDPIPVQSRPSGSFRPMFRAPHPTFGSCSGCRAPGNFAANRGTEEKKKRCRAPLT
jgi:hypothetical protein